MCFEFTLDLVAKWKRISDRRGVIQANGLLSPSGPYRGPLPADRSPPKVIVDALSESVMVDNLTLQLANGSIVDCGTGDNH